MIRYSALLGEKSRTLTLLSNYSGKTIINHCFLFYSDEKPNHLLFFSVLKKENNTGGHVT